MSAGPIVETQSSEKKSAEQIKGYSPTNGKRPGRPRGSKNKATLVGRKTFTKDAKVLAKKKCQAAVEILDKFLAGQKITDEQLRFADRVGDQAAAYAFGKPVQTQVVGGDGGEPIRTEASGDGLVDLKETMRRAALGLYMADRQVDRNAPAAAHGRDAAAPAGAGAGGTAPDGVGTDLRSNKPVPAPHLVKGAAEPEKPPTVGDEFPVPPGDGWFVRYVGGRDGHAWAAMKTGDPRDQLLRRFESTTKAEALEYCRLRRAEELGEL